MPVTIHSYTDADRDQLLQVWARALPIDAVSVDTFESRVLLDENFDPECLLLAKSATAVEGFILGLTARRLALGDADPSGERSWITALGVDPSSDLNGVGSQLLDELERRFRKSGKKECWVSSYPPGYFIPGIDMKETHLLDLFQSHGYEKQKEALSMDASIVKFRLDEKTLQSEKKLNARGIDIRPYRRSDLLRFLGFLEKTMPSDWVRVERRNLRKLSEGGFSEQQITVVEHQHDIIGYCQFEGSHFGPFGVADDYQGQGIGTVLLARTLDRMRTMGHHDAWVLWTDDLAAKVYGKFGFTETRRFAILRKILST